MKERVIQLMSDYTLEELATMLDENLAMIDSIADQFGAEFLGQFVDEEE